MSISKNLKTALVSAIDAIADKTATQAQKSRLVTVMKNEENLANHAYLALGKYLYENLRADMPEDIEQICASIDVSKERMTRAQEIYREVIRQEQVNSEINRAEVKENFRKVKEPIAEGAKTTAAKASVIAKDTVAKADTLKTAAVAKAEDLRAKAELKAEDLKAKAELKAEDIKAKAKARREKAAAEVEEDEDQTEIIDGADESAAVDSETIENAVMEDTEIDNTIDAETAEADDAPRPVEVISEEEFEENEPVLRSKAFSRAKKLRNIITKKDSDSE